MFENLIETNAKSQKSFGQMVVSVVVHAVVIVAAVKVTAGAAEAIKERVVDTTMVFLKPPPPPPPEVREPPPDVIVSTTPPPKGFQTVVALNDIPKEIPPVDLNQKALDPRDFMGKGVEGGKFTGVEGAPPLKDALNEEVFQAAELDDPVQPINQPSPRYPPVMQSAGITGSVDIQYVVNTEGRAEPESIKILASSHKAFEEPAKESILKSSFKPAKFRGRPVRQLVQQRLRFTLGG